MASHWERKEVEILKSVRLAIRQSEHDIGDKICSCVFPLRRLFVCKLDKARTGRLSSADRSLCRRGTEKVYGVWRCLLQKSLSFKNVLLERENDNRLYLCFTVWTRKVVVRYNFVAPCTVRCFPLALCWGVSEVFQAFLAISWWTDDEVTYLLNSSKASFWYARLSSDWGSASASSLMKARLHTENWRQAHDDRAGIR